MYYRRDPWSPYAWRGPLLLVLFLAMGWMFLSGSPEQEPATWRGKVKEVFKVAAAMPLPRIAPPANIPLPAAEEPQAAPAPAPAPSGSYGDGVKPSGSPVGAGFTISQGYGVGSHAPADVWGGLDFVNGGGQTLGSPAYSMIAGKVHNSQTYPCGNGVEVTNEHYRILYCHLGAFRAEDGATVKPGDVIGLIGWTGDVRPKSPDGSHLHFEIWEDGVNVNPLEYIK